MGPIRALEAVDGVFRSLESRGRESGDKSTAELKEQVNRLVVSVEELKTEVRELRERLQKLTGDKEKRR